MSESIDMDEMMGADEGMNTCIAPSFVPLLFQGSPMAILCITP